ncbi:histidine phosphatase family protein [Rufibacter immobilis]|uniref:Histidine phosphatase family protein n=1 Tax=Rufibacter immobilis TaxID=1348778 RepID=A0A3M9N3N9_9BACT|nr:histidine phosphatase family protein [Rufibacter immobilis]RNI32005.1 histidine phosphatase family protein [Rufibacter immobilis]
MKRFLSLAGLLGCLLSVCTLFSCAAQKKTPGASGKTKKGETVVYVVRHAEKAPSSGAMTDDPDLSEAGHQRAQALRDQLTKEPISALLATKYKRTQQTLQPLAQAKNLTVQLYNPTDYLGLAQNIKTNYRGKTLVVAGHSNTVLYVLEALGGKKPFTEVADHQYDYLFKVTLREGKDTQVEVKKYGEPSVAPAK